jgi:hypothetical protein
MPANLASVDAIMKEVYRGRIREQLQDEITALKRITRSSAGVTNEVGGKYVTFPIHTRRNSGIGSRLEGEVLPTPGQQGHAAARVGLKYAYGGIQLTGQAISLTDSDPKAFAKALDNEVEGLKRDVKKDMNRQVYGSGDGRIGVVRAAGTGVNIVPVADARLFQVGAQVDIVTLPSTVAVTNRQVTAVNLAAGANTVTLSGATFNVAVGQILVRTGSGPAAAGNREMTGLDAIISDTGTIYNINPATEPEWTAEVDSNGGTARALSEGLMTRMVDRIRTRGGETSVIFQSLGVRRSYANLLMQTRQTVNTTSFTGGFSGLAFTTDKGEIPVVADVDAPLGTQLYVNEDALTLYREKDWDWFDRDGSMWKQVRDASGDYDAWYARLYEYHELGTDRRNTHGKITDIQES